MISRSIMASVAGLALVATPVVAQAAEPVRIAAPANEAEGMAEGSGFLALIGFIAAITALVIIASDDKDEPLSV